MSHWDLNVWDPNVIALSPDLAIQKPDTNNSGFWMCPDSDPLCYKLQNYLQFPKI